MSDEFHKIYRKDNLDLELQLYFYGVIKMKGISNTRGISNGKLEHIFWGTVNGEKINGLHCYTTYRDERLYAEVRSYPNSRRIITANRGKKIAEAYVRDKTTGRLKTENFGKSTLFCSNWSRQEVVNCIDRLNNNGQCLIKYKSKVINKKVVVDPDTGMVFLNAPGTAYPILRL